MELSKNGVPQGDAYGLDLREGDGISLAVTDERLTTGSMSVTVSTGGSITADGTTFLEPDTSVSPPAWSIFERTKYLLGSGDATGATDRANIQAMIDAMPASGGKLVLAGDLTTDATPVTATIPVTIEGLGNGNTKGQNAATSISCLSGSTKAFDFQVAGCQARDFALVCTAGTTPVSGSVGLYFTDGDAAHVERVTVKGFYDNVHFEDGYWWWMRDCFNIGPVNYGLVIRDTNLPDGGDMTVTGCQFIGSTYNGAAAVRWESGGGLRFTNNKINTDATSSGLFALGVDIAIASNDTTAVLILSGNSIENITDTGVKIRQADGSTGSVSRIDLSGTEILMVGGSVAHAIDIEAASSSQIFGITLDDLTLRGPSLPATPAIRLSNVAKVLIGPSRYTGFGGLVLTDSGCSDVRDTNIKPALYQFSGGGDVPLTSTSFTALSGATGTVHATPNDILKITLNGVIYCTTANVVQTTFTFVRASDSSELGAEYITKTRADANGLIPVDYVLYYTVQSTDVSGGQMTVKPQWKSADGTKTVEWLNSSSHKGSFTVENIGPSAI